jgi:hypothetical protein
MLRSTRLGRVWLHTLLPLALVAALAGLAPGGVHASSDLTLTPPAAPAAVQVPEGNALMFRAFAVGTQNYECQTGDAGVTRWTFRQPQAALVGEDGTPLGIHGRGPFWAGYDGSRVVASSPTPAPALDPAHDVPLLLMRAVSAETDGRFAGVTYIQRLDTRGGVAPAGACDPLLEPTLAVPYLAMYYFYGPA